jgi:hypothetical protein
MFLLPSLSVDQLKAELLSGGVSVTIHIAKQELQTRLRELLSAEQEQAETQSVEGETSAQMCGGEDDVHSSAGLAPSSPAHTEVTLKTLPSLLPCLTADQLFELERLRIQMQMRQVEIERRRIEIDKERRPAEMQRELELAKLNAATATTAIVCPVLPVQVHQARVMK